MILKNVCFGLLHPVYDIERIIQNYGLIYLLKYVRIFLIGPLLYFLGPELYSIEQTAPTHALYIIYISMYQLDLLRVLLQTLHQTNCNTFLQWLFLTYLQVEQTYSAKLQVVTEFQFSHVTCNNFDI